MPQSRQVIELTYGPVSLVASGLQQHQAHFRAYRFRVYLKRLHTIWPLKEQRRRGLTQRIMGLSKQAY